MANEEVIRRDFQAELTPVGDGRTIDMRIVPYNTRALVRDGQGPQYEEEWLPGVFDKQIKAANRVWVNVEHEQGFRGVVGKGHEFTEGKDGFLGTVRIDEGPDGDKALRFVNDGSLAGVSVEAVPLKSQRTPEGVVQRVKARLLNVSLCRNPAYVDAQVLAVREAPPEEPEVERVAMPMGMDSMPDGVNACEANDKPGYSGGDACHTHDGSEASMKAAMASAMSDMKSRTAPEPDRSSEVLARIGYEPIVMRAVVNRPWDGSAARFEDDEYERSCLVCRTGDEPPKSRCSLPVLEPNGDLNVQGMHAAASRLSQTGLSTEEKGKAARKLVRYYRQAGETPPPTLLAAAGR